MARAEYVPPKQERGATAVLFGSETTCEHESAPLTPIQSSLPILLRAVAVMTLLCLNPFLIWLPIPIPLSLKYLFFGFLVVDESWGDFLLIPYLMLCVLFFFAARSVRKRRAVLPIISLLYFSADSIFSAVYVVKAVIEVAKLHLGMGEITSLIPICFGIPSAAVSSALAILLFLYLKERAKAKRTASANVDELPAASPSAV